MSSTEVPEDRRGRKLTMADKAANAFYNWVGVYLMLFGAAVHIGAVIGVAYWFAFRFGGL